MYTRPDILIVDEVGYMQLDRESSELLFRLICSRYESGSVILTSNKFFSDWGELMNDTIIATAILDRLLHHAHVINIRGGTYRLKDRLKTGVQTVPPTDIPVTKTDAAVTRRLIFRRFSSRRLGQILPGVSIIFNPALTAVYFDFSAPTFNDISASIS